MSYRNEEQKKEDTRIDKWSIWKCVQTKLC